MKKILYLLLLSVFLLPLVVRADEVPRDLLLYSKQTTVGSSIVFSVDTYCNNTLCDGMLKYDQDILEYKSISFSPLEDVGPSSGHVSIISNENGILKYDFNDENFSEVTGGNRTVKIEFEVKASPSNNEIEIYYAPIDEELNPIVRLEQTITINVVELKQEDNVTDDIDNNVENTVENSEKTTVETVGSEKECPKCEEKKCDNLWFIVAIASLIVNAILLVIIIFVSLKKKNKNDDNKAESVNTDKSI